MITLHNGARVIRVTASQNPVDKRWTGVVLADLGSEFVVWRVERDDESGVWFTFNGDYFTAGYTPQARLEARERAMGRYDYRRGA